MTLHWVQQVSISVYPFPSSPDEPSSQGCCNPHFTCLKTVHNLAGFHILAGVVLKIYILVNVFGTQYRYCLIEMPVQVTCRRSCRDLWSRGKLNIHHSSLTIERVFYQRNESLPDNLQRNRWQRWAAMRPQQCMSTLTLTHYVYAFRDRYYIHFCSFSISCWVFPVLCCAHSVCTLWWTGRHLKALVFVFLVCFLSLEPAWFVRVCLDEYFVPHIPVAVGEFSSCKSKPWSQTQWSLCLFCFYCGTKI